MIKLHFLKIWNMIKVRCFENIEHDKTTFFKNIEHDKSTLF